MALAGVVLSGPLAVAVVGATHPQPKWVDAHQFATHYHWLQLVPYAGGVVLVSSLVVLVAALHAGAGQRDRVWSASALGFTASFAALIVLNYALQTTYVPVLAREYDESSAALVAALSMSNPRSLAWGLEMWGWALFGAASWLVSPLLRGNRLEHVTRLLFAANGPVSILGAAVTVASPGWVLSAWGLFAFAAWNLLLAAMAVGAWLSFGRRIAQEQPPTSSAA